MNGTLVIMKALGWAGGTIHQVAAETGCTVEGLLYGSATDYRVGSDHNKGWFAGRNSTVGHNRTVNFPKYKGNLDFWLGVAEGLIQQEAGR